MIRIAEPHELEQVSRARSEFFDPGRRLPDRVIAAEGGRVQFAAFESTFTAEFWEVIQSIALQAGDVSVYMSSIEPSASDWMRQQHHPGVLVIEASTDPGDFTRVVNGPLNDPRSFLSFIDVLAIHGSDGRWLAWMERDAEFGLLWFSRSFAPRSVVARYRKMSVDEASRAAASWGAGERSSFDWWRSALRAAYPEVEPSSLD